MDQTFEFETRSTFLEYFGVSVESVVEGIGGIDLLVREERVSMEGERKEGERESGSLRRLQVHVESFEKGGIQFRPLTCTKVSLSLVLQWSLQMRVSLYP